MGEATPLRQHNDQIDRHDVSDDDINPDDMYTDPSVRVSLPGSSDEDASGVLFHGDAIHTDPVTPGRARAEGRTGSTDPRLRPTHTQTFEDEERKNNDDDNDADDVGDTVAPMVKAEPSEHGSQPPHRQSVKQERAVGASLEVPSSAPPTSSHAARRRDSGSDSSLPGLSPQPRPSSTAAPAKVSVSSSSSSRPVSRGSLPDANVGVHARLPLKHALFVKQEQLRSDRTNTAPRSPFRTHTSTHSHTSTNTPQLPRTSTSVKKENNNSRIKSERGGGVERHSDSESESDSDRDSERAPTHAQTRVKVRSRSRCRQ
jgi:hypothetical protein